MKSLVINRKFNKSLAMILLAVIILFDTFYIDYKRSYAAATTAITITIEEALMYLAGVCGVAFTGAYIADHPIPDDKKAIIKDSFEESCMKQNISNAEMMEWEHQLISGQLDKASACWHAFLDSLSETITKPDTSFLDSTTGMMSVKSVLDGYHFVYDGYSVNLDYDALVSSMGENFYTDSCDVIQLIWAVNMDNKIVLRLGIFKFGDTSYEKSLYVLNNYSVYIGNESHYTSTFNNGVMYEFYFNKTNNNIAKLSEYKTFYNTRSLREISSKSSDLIYTCPVYYGSDYTLPFQGKSITATAHYPGWNNVLEDGHSLSDYADVIGAGQTADTDVIAIPWGNVTDGTGHLESKWEKLWEKLAAGEITWEQFIEAVQEGVGTIALEKEISDEVEGDDAHPTVIEKELVPQNPDVPRTKDEIYEDNTVNASMTFDLKNVFPFCIPWDIYNIFSYLNQEPKAPKFEIPIPSYDRNGKLTMTNTITIDLSMFDSVALVFRVCLFLLFCLGLAFVTRALIRG